METKIVEWSIDYLFKTKWNKINSQPDYQRGKVWTPLKKKALIDSILRDIDIPKIYLRKLDSESEGYEVADGQQRLDALFDFINNDLKLSSAKLNGLELAKIDDHEVGNLAYNQLDADFKEKFDKYKLTIAIISNASGNEIRTLFARLQMGNQLNSAEKRNAIISRIGHHIDAMALNHMFFINSRIPKSRFKHQDYLSHVFALIFYDNNEPLKADLLEKLYRDENIVIDNLFLERVTNVLDTMSEIDKASKIKIINKFSFIDIFWFLFLNYGKISDIDVESFSRKYDTLEKDRRKKKPDPEKLISGNNVSEYDINLYNYIIGYEYAGSSIEHIEKRKNSFYNIFNSFIK